MDDIYNYFIEWKAKPVDPKGVKTIPEFCEKFGVTLADIAGFAKRPDYKERLTAEAIAWGQNKVPELLHVAFEEAKMSKDVASIEKFIDIVHGLKKKKEMGGNQFNFFNINDEQFKQIAARTAKALGGAGVSEEGR